MSRRGVALAAVVALGVAAATLATRRASGPPEPDAGGGARLESPAPSPGLASAAAASRLLPGSPPPGGAILLVLESETGRPVANARWRLEGGHGATTFEGQADAEGRAPMSAEALAAWGPRSLSLWGGDRRDERVHERPAPREDGAIEVRMDRFHVDFEGVVVDEAGRPVEGAQVVVEYWSRLSSRAEPDGDDLFRTTTDGQGRFRRSSKVWYPGLDEGDVSIEGHMLWVGGPGWQPTLLRPHNRGQKDLVVTLSRDRVHGTLEVEAITATGASAAGASVWLEAVPEPDDRTGPGAPVVGVGWRSFAERWRDEDDSREPARTWTPRPDGTSTWHHVLGRDGRRRIHPVPSGRHRLQALGEGSADVWVEVRPPPAVTTVVLRLDPLRAVRGVVRVGADSRWPCSHDGHVHRLQVDEWPEREWLAPFATGAFAVALPRTVRRARLSTWRTHPDVTLDLPGAAGDGDLDLGVVDVPSARELSGVLVWPEGTRPEPYSALRLEDDDGVVAEATTYWSEGGPFFDFVARRAPGPGVRILVRPRASEGSGFPVRVDGPFDFGAERLVVRLPEGTPGRAEDE